MIDDTDQVVIKQQLGEIPLTWGQPPDGMITQLNRGKGVVLDYVGHADITLILIQVDPAWQYSLDRDVSGRPDIHKQGNNWVLWGTITIHGVTRPCVGTCQGNKAEVEKELTGDLIRNGAMRFGIATKLWSKLDDATDKFTAEPAADRPMTGDELDKFEANCTKNGLDFDEILLDAHMSDPPMISEKPALAKAFTTAKRARSLVREGEAMLAALSDGQHLEGDGQSPSNDSEVQAPQNEANTRDMGTEAPLTDEFVASKAQVQKIQVLFGKIGMKDRHDKLQFIQDAINMSRKPTSTKNLTSDQASDLINLMESDNDQ